MSVTNRSALEKRLEQLHGQIRVSQIEAGRIISELRQSFKHGEWMPYSAKLFSRLRISRKSADRYVDAYQQAKDIGEPIVSVAEAAGLNVNRIPVREALFEVKQQNPTASPSKIVKMTNLKLDQEKKNSKHPLSVPSRSVADFVATITALRSELTELNRITKQVQTGSANLPEIQTLISVLHALEEDTRQRRERLAEAVNGSKEQAA